MDIGTFVKMLTKRDNGYTSQIGNKLNGSGTRIPRLAIIDAGYVLESLTSPKVTFEGESVISSKGFAVLGRYFPVAGDRVLMIPVGNTYVVAGKVGVPGTSGPRGGVASSQAPAGLVQYQATTGVANVGMTLIAGRVYQVHAAIFGLQVTSAATVTITLNELATTSVLYSPIAPVVPAGGTYGFSVQNLFVPPTTGVYQFYFAVTASAAGFRINTNGAVIVVDDIGP